MATLEDYLATARKAQGVTSDNQLAKLLGISRQTMCQIRRGRSLPSDDLMVRIADLAESDVMIALIRLNYWRTVHGRAKSTYKAMLERAGIATSVLLLVGAAAAFSAQPAHADEYTLWINFLILMLMG
jgi:DNA-binding XRE family transcriptional regulator